MPVAFSIPAYAPERAPQLNWAQRTSVREPQLEPKCAVRAQRSAGFMRRSVERRNLKPKCAARTRAAPTTFVIRQNDEEQLNLQVTHAFTRTRVALPGR